MTELFGPAQYLPRLERAAGAGTGPLPGPTEEGGSILRLLEDLASARLGVSGRREGADTRAICRLMPGPDVTSGARRVLPTLHGQVLAARPGLGYPGAALPAWPAKALRRLAPSTFVGLIDSPQN